MNLTVFLVFVCTVNVFASGYSQNVTFSCQKCPIEKVLTEVRSQTGYLVFCSYSVLKSSKPVTIKAKDMPVQAFLGEVFKGLPLDFFIENKTIIVTSKTDGKPNYNKDIFITGPPPVEISGTVKDNNGNPLIGASIGIKNTSLIVVTDNKGNFELSAPSTSSVLVVSFTGYRTVEIRIGETVNFDIRLDVQMTTAGDSIIVIGYGSLRKSDLTGSVSSVKENQLKERPSASLNQALSGRMAGVNVNTNSGRPGGRNIVRIRGFSSINSSNNPLYVVDGVILPVPNGVQSTQAIDFINPNDIESVEVLKDASATAIYGARGASGVILVTTKRGRGRSSISYDADFSIPKIGPHRMKVLNAREYLMVEDLAYQNIAKYDSVGWSLGRYASRNPALARTDPRLFDDKQSPLYETDWLKESTQSKLSQNHQLGFTGGNDKSNYAVSLGYRDDEGLIKTSYLERYSARFSFDSQLRDWIQVGGTLLYSNQEENLVDQNVNLVRQIAETYPFLPVKLSDGTWGDNTIYALGDPSPNPVHLLNDRRYILNTQATLGTLYSNINLGKNLEFRTVFGANVFTQENKQWTGRTIPFSQNGSASASGRRETYWSIENYLTYKKTISNHSFTGLLGTSVQETSIFAHNTGILNFASDYFMFNNIGAGSTNPGYGSSSSRFAFNSYFGRINYAFKDKYLFTATGRTDGSSKFGANHKYAFFPSAAVAWRISNEDFLKHSNVISNLKLRASYGVTGNSEIAPYTSLSNLSSTYAGIINGARVGGTGINILANPDLKWEKTAQSDLGLELGLFKGRLQLEADVYYRKTTDMLLDAPVPGTSGFVFVKKNSGSMENKGIELSLSTINIDNPKFSWRTIFNVSMNRNKVLSLATPSDIFDVGGPNFSGPTNIIRVGEAVGSFWGLVRLGTWGEDERAEAAKFSSYRNGLTILPGDLKYLDVDGDYAISNADRMIIGNGTPKGWGGFINSFRYGNFELIVELQYSYGNDIMNISIGTSEDRQSLANSYTTVLNAWTPQNQNTPIAEVRDARAGYVQNKDTRWIWDGSFIRGKNLLLAYNFPTEKLTKKAFSRLRVFGSVQNFFLASPYIGDPEVQLPSFGPDNTNIFSQGQDFHAYPKPTTIMFGLQASF